MSVASINKTKISIELPDGTKTPPVDLATMREALDQVRGKVARLKPDADFDAASTRAFSSTADELRQIIERFEHLAEEKADISAQQKEVMAEAKGRGYDTRALRAIIALRRRKPEDVAEEQAILDLYKSALGMD